MLKFRLTITDTDGREQQYPFSAPDAISVAVYLNGELANGGDFYGHRLPPEDPSILSIGIDAMMPDWDGDGLTFQYLYREGASVVTFVAS